MTCVLITGGAGFIGTNLAKRLLREGKYVFAIDNLITSSNKQKQVCIKHPHYRFVHHDITKPFPKKIIPHSSAIRTIYHLACPTGVPNLISLAEEMLLTCSFGTKYILDLARMLHADVIIASSSEVYGNPRIFPQSESYTGNVSPVGVRSPYEEGKRFTEALVHMYVKKYNLHAKIARIFNTYGPYMSQYDKRAIPTFVQQLQAGKKLTVYGKGEHTRTFCYVDDLLEGLNTIQKFGEDGEVYNIGSDEEISIIDLANKLQTLSKKSNGIMHLPYSIEDHTRRIPSLEKIKKLGWKPYTSLDEGLKRTLLWYGL